MRCGSRTFSGRTLPGVCDEVWYIHTDQEIRIERLMSSRGYTREKAENIIARQATEGFFREHADYIITE